MSSTASSSKVFLGMIDMIDHIDLYVKPHFPRSLFFRVAAEQAGGGKSNPARITVFPFDRHLSREII